MEIRAGGGVFGGVFWCDVSGGVFGLGNPGHSDPGNPGGRGVKKPCHPSGGVAFSGITHLLFCCKINLLLAENGEKLISAHPQISTHSQCPQI